MKTQKWGDLSKNTLKRMKKITPKPKEEKK